MASTSTSTSITVPVVAQNAERRFVEERLYHLMVDENPYRGDDEKQHPQTLEERQQARVQRMMTVLQSFATTTTTTTPIHSDNDNDNDTDTNDNHDNNNKEANNEGDTSRYHVAQLMHNIQLNQFASLQSFSLARVQLSRAHHTGSRQGLSRHHALNLQPHNNNNNNDARMMMYRLCGGCSTTTCPVDIMPRVLPTHRVDLAHAECHDYYFYHDNHHSKNQYDWCSNDNDDDDYFSVAHFTRQCLEYSSKWLLNVVRRHPIFFDISIRLEPIHHPDKKDNSEDDNNNNSDNIIDIHYTMDDIDHDKKRTKKERKERKRERKEKKKQRKEERKQRKKDRKERKKQRKEMKRQKKLHVVQDKDTIIDNDDDGVCNTNTTQQCFRTNTNNGFDVDNTEQESNNRLLLEFGNNVALLVLLGTNAEPPKSSMMDFSLIPRLQVRLTKSLLELRQESQAEQQYYCSKTEKELLKQSHLHPTLDPKKSMYQYVHDDEREQAIYNNAAHEPQQQPKDSDNAVVLHRQLDQNKNISKNFFTVPPLYNIVTCEPDDLDTGRSMCIKDISLYRLRFLSPENHLEQTNEMNGEPNPPKAESSKTYDEDPDFMLEVTYLGNRQNYATVPLPSTTTSDSYNTQPVDPRLSSEPAPPTTASSKPWPQDADRGEEQTIVPKDIDEQRSPQEDDDCLSANSHNEAGDMQPSSQEDEDDNKSATGSNDGEMAEQIEKEKGDGSESDPASKAIRSLHHSSLENDTKSITTTRELFPESEAESERNSLDDRKRKKKQSPERAGDSDSISESSSISELPKKKNKVSMQEEEITQEEKKPRIKNKTYTAFLREAQSLPECEWKVGHYHAMCKSKKNSNDPRLARNLSELKDQYETIYKNRPMASPLKIVHK